MTGTNKKLREALQAISHIDDTTNHSVDASAALDQIGQIARQALALRPEQVPMTCEPGEWNSIQIASWIGSKLMHEPPMFERATVCKFVRSLGRHPTLLKHSPKSHPAPSVLTADHIPDAGKMSETAAPVVERDALDAARYRWLADCNNYPEAVTLISDGSLTADALGKAIDAATRKGPL